MLRALTSVSLLTLSLGCASKAPPAPTGPAAPSAPGPAPAETTVAEPPPDAKTEPERFAAPPPDCEGNAPCVPPPAFTAATCQGRFEALALTMFEKHSPWQRLYLKAEYLEAVNAHDKHLTAAPIVFGEEVIVIGDRGASKGGQVQVSGSDIDVLRWDGTCATVAREMFVTTMMPEVKAPPISWRHLGGNVRGALLTSKYVKMAHTREKEVCQGEHASDPSPACEKARRMLNDSITVAVRGGISLPVPDELPVWATREELAQTDTVALSDGATE